MKDKEFVKKIKALGYKIQESTPSDIYFQIMDTDGLGLVWAGRKITFSVDNQDSHFDELGFDEQSELMNIVADYVATPLSERKEEPRFKVRIFPAGVENRTDWFLSKGSGESLRAEENALIFTPSSYQEYCDVHPDWLAFLPDYGTENTDSFIPVKSGDPDD